MKNMNTKYKLMFLIPWLALTGCNEDTEHKNVITGMISIDDEQLLSLKDLQTGQERIYEFSSGRMRNRDYNLFEIGDTVTLRTAGLNFLPKDHYAKNVVLYAGQYSLVYNKDSIEARQERKYKQIYELKQKMMKTR